MKKIYKAIRWIILNAALAYFGYIGLIGGQAWAKNIFLFGIWAHAILLMIVAVFSEVKDSKGNTIKHYCQNIGLPVPLWANAAYDLATASLLAAFGYFEAASVCIIQMLIVSALFTPDTQPTTGRSE